MTDQYLYQRGLIGEIISRFEKRGHVLQELSLLDVI